MNITKSASYLRLFTVPSALAVAIGLALVQPLLAQSGDDDQEAQALEQITVTGSRIPREGFITPTPITVLNAEDIRATGAVTIGDLLNELPQLGSTFSLSNSSRFIGTVGLGLLDLRRLGSVRTLVLVNGRRHVGANAGTSSVDVNTIPVEWIDRVEVITGGASAVYGADAISGVVNFILKRSFDGYGVRAQTGISDEGSFNRSFASLTAGQNFAEGRGSAGISLEASSQDRLRYQDRAFSRISYRSILNPNAPPGRLIAPNAGLFSFSEGGVFSVPGLGRFIFDPDGSFRPQNLGTFFDAQGNCQDCDYLDLNRVADLQPGFDRVSFNTNVNFDLSPEHQLFFEGKYARTESSFFGQPVFSSPAAYRIARDNAYVSPQLGAFMDANNVSLLNIARFDVDAGQRGEDVTRETTRAVLGLEGVLFRDWTYEISANYGRTSESRSNLNNRINERFFASIDAVLDENGNPVCRSVLDPTSINTHTGQVVSEFARVGCVPTSIFGAGAVSPDAAAWFNTTSNSSTVLTQQVLSASIGHGELFTLPAGPVGFAGGVEYRKEKSQQNTDALAAAGLTFLNAIPSRGGSYDVNELYAEFTVPLLGDLPGIQNLTLDLAGRYSDYSTIGSTSTWRGGLDWTVFDDLRFRATASKAIRAPNIAELFNPQSENFFSIQDPCSAPNVPNAPDPAVRRANCTALGVPEDFVSTMAATRRGLSGGNPDLDPEAAKTYTLGFVYTPSWAPDLGVSVDWWDIEITDAISSISGQVTANRCVDAPGGINNEFCERVRRDAATFEIDFVTAISQNLQKLQAQGIDLEVAYRFDLFGGDLNARAISTFLRKRRTFAFQNDPDEFTENRGVLGDPRRLVNLSLGYTFGPASVSWQTRFIDDMLRVSNESFRSNPDQQYPIRTGSVTYTDLQTRYRFSGMARGLEAYLGIDNVFDKNPPYALFGDGEGSALFDNIGRYYYVGLNYTF